MGGAKPTCCLAAFLLTAWLKILCTETAQTFQTHHDVGYMGRGSLSKMSRAAWQWSVCCSSPPLFGTAKEMKEGGRAKTALRILRYHMPALSPKAAVIEPFTPVRPGGTRGGGRSFRVDKATLIQAARYLVTVPLVPLGSGRREMAAALRL